MSQVLGTQRWEQYGPTLKLPNRLVSQPFLTGRLYESQKIILVTIFLIYSKKVHK